MNDLPTTGALISRKRLQAIPKPLRLAHEYCFFLHDECVRILAEYEEAHAGHRTINFEDTEQSVRFQRLADEFDVIRALRELGYDKDAKRTILNRITVSLTSDLLHHIYEGLRCLERRKFVVALNLFRKPLTDNLVLLSWMLADEDEFYEKFENESPSALTPSKTGNMRHRIIEGAVAELEPHGLITEELLIDILFNSENGDGLYGYFQHAVHLVTIQKSSIATTPENLNFIFKDPLDDDIYELIYGNLPIALYFGMSVIMKLFDRIKPMDDGSAAAFQVRSRLGFMLLYEQEWRNDVLDILSSAGISQLKCATCRKCVEVTIHNAARILLSDSFRCTNCRCVNPFPFSWIF